MGYIDISAMGTEVAYVLIGMAIGLVCLISTAAYVPAIIDRLTPNINEEREIVRGNRAVAEYFGRIIQAIILGIALIISAAIIGGMGKFGGFAQ